MGTRRQPRRMKVPSVYFDKQSGRYICDFHELVDGEIRQRRLKFRTEKQAEEERTKQEAKRKRAQRRGKGALTDAQLETAVWLFQELESFEWKYVTARDLVDHFRATYNPMSSRPFSEAVDDFEAFKRSSGIKRSSFKDIPPRLRKLKEHFEGKTVGELTSTDFLGYVEAQSVGMRYKIYALVRELLDYSSHDGRKDPPFKRKILDEFEFESKKGKRFKLERTEAPTILHLAEIRAALKKLPSFKVKDGAPGEWLGFFVLGTFCGLRPHEIQALGRIQRCEFKDKDGNTLGADYVELGEDAVWTKHIQLQKGLIVCDDKIGTKTAERRNVKIHPNVLEWLKLIKKRQLPLCVHDRRFARYGKFFRIEVMDEERQKNKKWDDVFRHTFATFLWAFEGMTESEYVSQLGHSMKVAKKNYLGDLYDDEKSSDFFGIFPTSEFLEG